MILKFKRKGWEKMGYIVYFRFENCLQHNWFCGYTKKEIRSKLKNEYPGCEISSFERRSF